MTLDELDALAEKATPGPYTLDGLHIGKPKEWHAYVESVHGHATVSPQKQAQYLAALFPERVRAMIKAIRTADAMRKWATVMPGSIQYDAARAALEKMP